MGIHLFDSALLTEGLGKALARLHVGVFALDACGRLLFSNPTAKRLIGDGLNIANGRLVTDNSQARNRLESTLVSASSIGWGEEVGNLGPLLINRRGEKRPIALYVLPLISSPNPAAEILTHARVIVLAVDPEIGAPTDPTIVRDLLGLTLGEARVAALVGAGVPPREAAQRLGITEQTARSTLKGVFSKTGISRQSELVLLLSKLSLG